MAAQPSVRVRRIRVRAGPTLPSKATRNAAANSPPIAPGCLPSSRPIERSTANGTNDSQWMSSAPPGAYTKRRCS